MPLSNPSAVSDIGLANSPFEVDFGPVPRSGGSFSVAGTGMTPGKSVKVRQTPGPYTDKGTREDEAEMDHILVSGFIRDSATVECYWFAYPGPVRGNFKFTLNLGV